MSSQSHPALKTVAVTNATAKHQGIPVVKTLSESGYHVRCLTRNTKSPDAIKLQEYKNVTLVQADVSDIASIEKAFEGADIIVANSIPDPQSIIASPGTPVKEDTKTLGEYEQGKRYADAAKKVGAKIVIWPTLPDVAKLSGNKYDKVTHFQEKARVQEYMKKIDLPAVFLSPSFYMENMIVHNSVRLEQDKIIFELPRANLKDVVYGQIYSTADYGRYVKLLIDNYASHHLKHKVILASLPPQSVEQLLATIQNVTRKKETVFNSLPYMVTEGSDLDEMMKYVTDPSVSKVDEVDVRFTQEFFQSTGFVPHTFEAFVREKLAPKLLASCE